MTTKKYKLIITERQSELIMQSLDLFSRLSIGQIQRLNDISWVKNKKGWERKASEGNLKKIQKQLFPKLTGLNHSYGIHSKDIPDKTREIYDIYKVMMYEFNKDKGAMNVYADKPRQTSKQKLPEFGEVLK